MVFALPENEGSARGGARSFDPLLPRALGKSLRPMAGEHSGLVHQPPGLVGTPNPGLVPASGKRKPETGKQRGSRPDRITGPRMETGRGHARHMVFVVAMGVRDDGR